MFLLWIFPTFVNRSPFSPGLKFHPLPDTGYQQIIILSLRFEYRAAFWPVIMTFLHPEMCPNFEAFRVVKHASRWDRLGARNEGEESKLFSLDVSQIGAKKESWNRWGKIVFTQRSHGSPQSLADRLTQFSAFSRLRTLERKSWIPAMVKALMSKVRIYECNETFYVMLRKIN